MYGIGASIYGAVRGGQRWVDSGRRAVYALAGLMTLAFAILEAAFLRSDFTFNVVAGHSSTTTPTFYKATAAYGHFGRDDLQVPWERADKAAALQQEAKVATA